jgi:hypothetical protein
MFSSRAESGLYPLSLTCALLTGVAVAPVHAQDYDSVTAVSVVDTADEGPHIYWREESIAVVILPS